MSRAARHPTPDPPAPWLLVPPASVTIPRLQHPEAGVLEVVVAITSAPQAIPPELWNAPVRYRSSAELRTLLLHLCTSLSKRIPFLQYDFLEWEEDPDSLFHFVHIPVDPIGIDSCNGEVFGYGPVVAWVAALHGYMTEDLPYPLPEALSVGFDVGDLAPSITKGDATQPLAGLADVIDLLSHNTGTFFLDACPACWYAYADEPFDWTDENIAWLEQDAARTLSILARIDALEAWVQADRTRMRLVWQTLLEAYADVQTEAVPTPQTLMDLWGVDKTERAAIEASDNGATEQEHRA